MRPVLDWPESWILLPVMVGGSSQHHIVPLADLMIHRLDAACPCGPEEDAEAAALWHHFARDGRESHEAGRPMH